MPRYFFDITENGDNFRDDEGTELHDIREVRKDAVTTLLELAKSHADEGNDFRIAAVVKDATGIVVARISLAVKVEAESPAPIPKRTAAS